MLGPSLSQLVSVLRTLPAQTFDIRFASGNPQARDMAMQLRTALVAGGWTPNGMGELPHSQEGIVVMAPRPAPPVSALITWARRMGVEPDVRMGPKFNQVHILIGTPK